jgi:ribosomal protein L6P/L9E
MQFDAETNTINYVSKEHSPLKNKSINTFNRILYSFENYFFEKIKFKGKGFRLKLKKSKKIIKFFFGHSHINIIFLKNLVLKKTNKYKFTIKSTNPILLKIVARKICGVKPVNVYTNRGIRTGRQIIFKRKGKKGSYV